MCLYCENPYTSRISSHVENIHTDEEKVKEAKLHPKHSRERKTLLREIQNKGNFNHNAKVSKNTLPRSFSQNVSNFVCFVIVKRPSNTFSF